MMKLVNSLDLLSEEIVDGTFNKINDFCKNKINSSICKRFYNELKNEKDGLYSCPYGFNCIKNGTKIHNCILLKENYSNKKMQKKKSVEQKIFFINEIMSLIKIDEENAKYQGNCELLYKSMSDFLHDITKVNKMIDNNSKNICKTNLIKRDISKLESIYHLSDFITKRIELYRLTSNPAIIQTGKKRERNAYKLWDIYRHIFNDFCRESNLSIDMKIYNMAHIEENGQDTLFKANDSITILPYLLIDNAVKYSENNSVIKIRFYQSNGNLKKITISSRPSYVIMEDTRLFFQRGYRSSNNTSKSSGSGLGLDIVRQICDFNNINVEIYIDADEEGRQKFVIVMNLEEEVNND